MVRFFLVVALLATAFSAQLGCDSGDGDADADGDGDADADGDGDGDGDADCPEDAECCTDADCSDNIFCNGVETCDRGECQPDPRAVIDPMTGQYRIFCDDGFACTDDMCNESANVCVHIPIHDRCVDDFICDGIERCMPGSEDADAQGCIEGSPYQCDDGDTCTDDYCDDTGSINRCDEDEDCGGLPCVQGYCVCHVRIRDADLDGFGDSSCTLCDEDGCTRGNDCDDTNAAVNPDGTEICDDGWDNNCDRVRDYADDDCDVPNDTCNTAIVLSPGVRVHSSTRGTRGNVDSSCAPNNDPDVVFAFNLMDVQDVEVVVEMRGSRRVTLALTTDCGNPNADLQCYTERSFNHVFRALLPGTYYLVVSSPGDADFALTINPADLVEGPDGDVCADALPIATDGTVTTGSFVGTHRDLEIGCADMGDNLRDLVYEFSLNTEQTADFSVSVPGGTGLVAVALQESCGLSPTELGCWSGDEATAIGRVWRLLPGTYSLIVAHAEEAPVDVSVELSPIDPGLYIFEDFSSEPVGWELSGAWEQGVPGGAGDPDPDAGGCIATNIGGSAPIGMTFTNDYAQTPGIDLRGATAPSLRFRSWMSFAGGGSGGGHLEIATDPAGPYAQIPSSDVSPMYDGWVSSGQAWTGSHTSWSDYSADLSDYIDEIIYIRFAAYSPMWGAAMQGWYIDTVMVVEDF